MFQTFQFPLFPSMYLSEWNNKIELLYLFWRFLNLN